MLPASSSAAGEQRDQQCHDHQPAGWVVAEVAAGAPAEPVPEVVPRRGGRVQEVAEPGMLAADEAPQRPHRQQRQDGVAGQRMQPFRLALGEIGGKKGEHKYPVKHADQRIPNANLGV